MKDPRNAGEFIGEKSQPLASTSSGIAVCFGLMSRMFKESRAGTAFGRERKAPSFDNAATRQRQRKERNRFQCIYQAGIPRILFRSAWSITKSIKWDKVCTVVQICLTAAAVSMLLVEGFYAASHNEKYIRSESEIEFQIQGMQTLPSTEDLQAVGHGEKLQSHAVRVVAVDGVELHPVGKVLVDVIRKHGVRSMIDWPCREHRDIVPSALQLAMNVSTTNELAEATFRYFCVDKDSAELARSSFAVRDAVGRRRGLHFVRQKSSALFKLGGGPATTAKAGSGHLVGGTARETGEPGDSSRFEASSRGIGKGIQGDLRSGPQSGREGGSIGLSARSENGAELIFSWGGREGGRNSTTEIRELILSAARSGARLALIGAHAAYGTRWEMPDEQAGAVGNLETGRLTGPKMPYFPFGNAILSMNGEFSPMSEIDDTRFLVLYRLDAIPKALVHPGDSARGRRRKPTSKIAQTALKDDDPSRKHGGFKEGHVNEDHEDHRVHLTPRERIELDIEEANYGAARREDS